MCPESVKYDLNKHKSYEQVKQNNLVYYFFFNNIQYNLIK